MDFDKFNDICKLFFQERGLDGDTCNMDDTFSFEPCTRKTGGKRSDFFDGMQLLYFLKEDIFEVSEYQAGANQDRLHIYLETKKLKVALTKLSKGNRKKPIKIY